MPTLTEERIADLLTPYHAAGPFPPGLLEGISQYLDLLMLWNSRTNLTAIRDPEQLVQRQIGESLFAAQLLGTAETLLDFGSGGGFPGIPLQLASPLLRVTLAESQGKKASFLREACRVLGLRSTVWASRVETITAEILFDVVAMRAVDQAGAMLPVAQSRVASGGRLLRYLSASEEVELAGWSVVDVVSVPLSQGRIATWERM